jgi:L-proline 4-hydroxylase
MADAPVNSVISAENLQAYERDGSLLLPGHLAADLLRRVTDALADLRDRDVPQRIVERDGRTVRSVYGPHQTDEAIGQVVRSRHLLFAAAGVLGASDLYIHQSKVNWKAAFVGDVWDWHQDFIYWLRDDGIKRPDLVNVAVFLDEVTEFNGPLTFVPGSHRYGVLAASDDAELPEGYADAPAWVSTLTATEKYGVTREVITAMVERHGMHSPKGPAGSVLLFHPNILHASSPNISPFGRATLIVVYNRCDNAPTPVAEPRPEFLAARDWEAVTAWNPPARTPGALSFKNAQRRTPAV